MKFYDEPELYESDKPNESQFVIDAASHLGCGIAAARDKGFFQAD